MYNLPFGFGPTGILKREMTQKLHQQLETIPFYEKKKNQNFSSKNSVEKFITKVSGIFNGKSACLFFLDKFLSICTHSPNRLKISFQIYLEYYGY